MPVIGVNMTLPMIAAAGTDKFDALMNAGLVGACRMLRCLAPHWWPIADREIATFAQRGWQVFRSLDDTPTAAG